MQGFTENLKKSSLNYKLLLFFTIWIYPSYSVESSGFIGAYYSLEEILNVFNKKEYRDDPSVNKVLRLYEALTEDIGNVTNYETSNPFIAIEGNHRSRRFVVARQLARALRAANLRNPPEFMNFLKFDFKGVELRRAFYSLALYANALEARRILQERPVVTAGYWLDIAAFSLAKKYPTKFPDKNSSEMMWPRDLLVPDIVFYINSPLPIPAVNAVGGTRKLDNPLKPRLVELYRSWTYPRVVELSGSIFSHNEMFTEMFRHINFIKQSKFKKYLKIHRKKFSRGV